MPEIIWKVRRSGIIFDGELRGDQCYTGCICRYTCTTLCYIRRKIFGAIENYILSLPLKRSPEPEQGLMTAHALFLAMDDFFSLNRELF